MNWINSWAKGNKKEKYNIEIRLGKITILELKKKGYGHTKPKNKK